MIRRDERGFTLIEAMITIGLLAVLMLASITNYDTYKTQNNMVRTSVATDRIMASVRTFAKMPAALRNSARASLDGQRINPDLYACVSGVPANGCKNGGTETPFTLYSPLVALDALGNPSGIHPVSAPSESTKPARYDAFGSPCQQAGPTCPIQVFTSFKAQCPPKPLAGPVPVVLTPDLMQPMPTCTIAVHISVTYTVQLDPDVVADFPSLGVLSRPVSGTVTTPVILISGNTPQ